jgi:predicted DNA-binding protein YlxM (UPF0122 family)|tara:strand:+ start:283 stop:570 length:288 start_codon:yes stop_codon:yes gene_type:complete
MQGIDEQSAKDFLDRNKLIYNLYKKGATMEQIGEKYGVSKQRIHQIIRRCKIGEGEYYDAHKLETEKKEQDPANFDSWLKDKGVKSINKKVLETL